MRDQLQKKLHSLLTDRSLILVKMGKLRSAKKRKRRVKAEDGEILSCGAADPPGCLIRCHSQRVLEGEQSGDLRVLREVKGDPVDAFLGDDL